MPPQAPFQPHKPPGLSPQHRRLLTSVSRSFDLSIRLLPAALQAPIGIGYLLARAADTVADTTTLALHERQQLLDRLAQMFRSPQTLTSSPQDLVPFIQAFAAQQNNPHERALMQALPQCLALLSTLENEDQASVRQVLGHITQGQQLDMLRFGPGLHAIETEDELNHYTWLVAGCVGEFWTELCERHLPGYAQLPTQEMMRLGRIYGMGLQRLNILRDAGADLSAGRCYWPAATLATVDLTPEKLARAAHAGCTQTWQMLAPLYTQWLDHTHTQLNAGMRYTMALKPLRLRLATGLPALIGARTVTLLRQTGPMALTQHVKMPRQDMRQLMWQMVLGWGRAKSLGRLFEKMSTSSPD